MTKMKNHCNGPRSDSLNFILKIQTTAAHLIKNYSRLFYLLSGKVSMRFEHLLHNKSRLFSE